MKTFIQILFLTIFTVTLSAQVEPPTPPEPPTPGSTSSSISVNKTDDNLRYKAKFDKSRYEKVKALLIEKLGEEGLTVNGNTYKWVQESKAFEGTLTNKTLNFNLDYENASKSLANQVNEVISDLKYAISNRNPEEDVRRAQRKLEKAQREIERAKREVERAQREIERAKREVKRKRGKQISKVQRIKEEIEKRKIERDVAIKLRKEELQQRREIIEKKRIEQKETIKALKKELEKRKEKEQKEKSN